MLKTTKNKIILALIFLFAVMAPQQGYAKNDPLEEIIFYNTLKNFTCRLQVDYYKEFTKYLKKTKAPKLPKLIKYFLGLSLFEMGNYEEAYDSFSKFINQKENNDFIVYAQIMQKVVESRLNNNTSFPAFYKKIIENPKTSNEVKSFLGYILLRFDIDRELSLTLLAKRPKKFFSEVKEKWITSIFSKTDKVKLVPFRLKRPDYQEEYDSIKLKTETIPLVIKYFDAGNIALLEEMAWQKAKKKLKGKNINNMLYLARLELLRSAGPKYEAASKYLQNFLNFNPGSSEAHLYLGETYYLQGKKEKAKNTWNYVRENGDNVVLRKLAVIFSKLGEKDSLALLEKSRDEGIKDNPPEDIRYFIRYKDYYRTLGRVYLNTKEYGKAGKTFMRSYQRSMAGNPRFFDQNYLLELGFSLVKSGRYKEGIKFALKGLSSVNPIAYPYFHTVNFGLYMLNQE